MGKPAIRYFRLAYIVLAFVVAGILWLSIMPTSHAAPRDQVQSNDDWHVTPAIIEIVTDVQNLDCSGAGTNYLFCDIEYVNPSAQEYANVDVQYSRPENVIGFLVIDWQGEGRRFLSWSGNDSVRTNGGTFSFASGPNGLTIDALLSNFSIYDYSASELILLGIDTPNDFESDYLSGSDRGKVAAWSWEESSSSVITGTLSAYWVVAGPAPDPPPVNDGSDGNWAGALCSFPVTDTQTVTGTGGVTSTEVITTGTYTVSANLLNNPSFESGVLQPDGWQVFVNNQLYLGNYNPYWVRDGLWASDGVGSINAFEDWQIKQFIDISESVKLQFGASFICSYTTCPSEVVFLQDNTPFATLGEVYTSHTVFSDNVQYTAGLDTLYGFGFNAGNPGTAWFDDAFAVPTDEDGNLLCNADFYPTPDVGDGGDGNNGGDPEPPNDDGLPNDPNPIPIPPFLGEGVCYECPIPTNVLSIGSWIAWLACILNNLFFCNLRTWFLEILNWLYGVFVSFGYLQDWLIATITGWVSWAYDTALGAINYAADFATTLFEALPEIPRQLLIYVFESELVQMIWRSYHFLGTVFDIAMRLGQWLIEQIVLLYQSVIELITMLSDLFTSIRDSYQEDPYEIILALDDDVAANAVEPAQLFSDGLNFTKVLWFILAALATIDSAVTLGLKPYLWISVGILAIGLIMWTLAIWGEDIIPI